MDTEYPKIKIAIIGAGDVGVGLAEELLHNKGAAYVPRCFIDTSGKKMGREIHGIPVHLEDEATLLTLRQYEIQEIVFAIPSMEDEKRKSCLILYKKQVISSRYTITQPFIPQEANGI